MTSDAKYEAWKHREERRQDQAAETRRILKLYPKPAPKPEPEPEPEPAQMSLFDTEITPIENGHTL